MSKTKQNDDHDDNDERIKDLLLTDSLQNEPHDQRPASTSLSLLTTNVNLNATQRPVYNQKRYQNEFARTSDDESTKQSNRIKSFLSLLHPRQLLSVFTIVNFIVDYDFKKNFFADVFSGITGNFLVSLLNRFDCFLYE
jgi:hypothetical protein